MNQRRGIRFETDQKVWITIFGEPDIRLPGGIRNVSERGIGIALEEPVATGAAIKIQLDDTLLLGEVIYCRREPIALENDAGAYSEFEFAIKKEEAAYRDASFYVGVELEQSLCGLLELSQSLQAFADPASGAQKTKPVEDRAYQN